MERINIKPISINEMYVGKKDGTRFKAKKYTKWLIDVGYMLPKIQMPNAPYKITYEFGFSSRGSDIDNHVKPFQDVLQKKYGFNDNKIYEFTAKKVIVNTGKEFIKFKIEPLSPSLFDKQEDEPAF